MSTSTIRETIIRYIKEIGEENGRTLTHIHDQQNIVDDLGLTSLQIATLISFLETDLEIDPFTNGDVAITDIRTIGDLCNVYETAYKNKDQSQK